MRVKKNLVVHLKKIYHRYMRQQITLYKREISELRQAAKKALGKLVSTSNAVRHALGLPLVSAGGKRENAGRKAKAKGDKANG